MKYSRTEARRLINDGAIDVGGATFKPPKMFLSIKLRIGKKKFIKAGIDFTEEDLLKFLTENEFKETENEW